MLALLAATALAAPSPWDTDATTFRLPNGLTVVLEPQEKTDRVALYLRFGVGGRDEVEGKRGCAHLFEHLMFQRSAHVPEDHYDLWLREAGGSNYAGTSHDETFFTAEFPAEALERVLFLESDRIGFLQAALTAETVANQQEVVLREDAENNAEPHGRDFDALNHLVWPENHPYQRAFDDAAADIRGFDVPSAEAFWQTYYRPSNAVLVLVGRFEANEARARVEHWFSDVPDRGPPPTRAVAPSVDTTPSRATLFDRVEDSTLFLAWPGPPAAHPDAVALDVLTYALAGGDGTPVSDRLVSRGLADDANVWMHPGELGSIIALEATTRRKNLDSVGARMMQIVERARREPFSDAAVAAARAAMISDVESALVKPLDRAEALARCVVATGATGCMAQRRQAILSITSLDLLRVAQAWLGDAHRVQLTVIPEGQPTPVGSSPLVLP